MKSLGEKYLSAIRLLPKHATSLGAIREHRGKQDLYTQQTPEVLASLRQVAVIESTESSNRLEGVVAPHDRVEALVLKSTTPKDRSEQEIAGYRDALDLVHESARDMALSINVILQLHQMLYRYLPAPGGKWKMTQNEIVERNQDGSVHRIRFTPVTPVATPGAMETLVTQFAAAVEEDQEPLILIPLAILDFLCIHPFTDGNGRMARLLTLLLMYHFEYEVGRYISLERIFEESEKSYYETLEASSHKWHDEKHDAFPWMTYFWGVMLRAYSEFEARVGTLRTARGAKTVLVESAVGRRVGPFAISDIERDCPGVSRDMIRHVLRRLKGDGKIVVQGKGRGAKWVQVST